MPQKLITELQLRDDVTDELNFPSDDGIQSYRVTAAMLRDYILPDEVITRAKLLAEERFPIGGIIPFAGTTAPDGYLICDGSAVSRTTYADLFAVIDEFHGQGDNSTTFNIPDYRGRFLRGVSGSTDIDPDKAGRTAMNTGGNTGNNVGSVQGHAFQTHTHTQDSHNHTQSSHNHTQDSHNHTQDAHGHDIRGTTGGSTNPLGHASSTAVCGITGSTGLAYMTDAGGSSTNIIEVITATNNAVTATNNAATAVNVAATAVNIATTATNQNAAASGSTAQTSTTETRPVNAYVNYLIKY